LNIGIIGAGGIARKLHLPQIAELNSEGVRVTHLAGRKLDRLNKLASDYDVPNVTTDADSLLDDKTIDGIIIATPHPLHVKAGIRALEAGKHVLMQKPLCGDMEEANAFVEAAEKSSGIVVALPHYGPDILGIRRAAQSGQIGKLSSAHCRVSHGGPEVYYSEIRDYFGEDAGDLWFFKPGEAAVGALFDMGVYAVGAITTVMGSVTSVMGMAATVDKATTLEDTASLILRFENGAIGTAETGWCDPARSYMMSIHGTAGKITAPGATGTGITRWEPGSYTREDEPPVPHALDLTGLPDENSHTLWLRCIKEGVQPDICNARTARHVTEILLAGLESAKTGQMVAVNSRL
jgi:predicted dehydrogenase